MDQAICEEVIRGATDTQQGITDEVAVGDHDLRTCISGRMVASSCPWLMQTPLQHNQISQSFIKYFHPILSRKRSHKFDLIAVQGGSLWSANMRIHPLPHHLQNPKP